MKGFIEVTDADGNEILINVSAIQVVINAKLFIEEKSIDVKETYAELKALIEAATEGDKAETLAPEIPNFYGTRTALLNLSITNGTGKDI